MGTLDAVVHVRGCAVREYAGGDAGTEVFALTLLIFAVTIAHISIHLGILDVPRSIDPDDCILLAREGEQLKGVTSELP